MAFDVKIDPEKMVDRAATHLLPLLREVLARPVQIEGTIGGVNVDVTIQSKETK